MGWRHHVTKRHYPERMLPGAFQLACDMAGIIRSHRLGILRQKRRLIVAGVLLAGGSVHAVAAGPAANSVDYWLQQGTPPSIQLARGVVSTGGDDGDTFAHVAALQLHLGQTSQAMDGLKNAAPGDDSLLAFLVVNTIDVLAQQSDVKAMTPLLDYINAAPTAKQISAITFERIVDAMLDAGHMDAALEFVTAAEAVMDSKPQRDGPHPLTWRVIERWAEMGDNDRAAKIWQSITPDPKPPQPASFLKPGLPPGWKQIPSVLAYWWAESGQIENARAMLPADDDRNRSSRAWVEAAIALSLLDRGDKAGAAAMAGKADNDDRVLAINIYADNSNIRLSLAELFGRLGDSDAVHRNLAVYQKQMSAPGHGRIDKTDHMRIVRALVQSRNYDEALRLVRGYVPENGQTGWNTYGAVARIFAAAEKTEMLKPWLKALQRPESPPAGYCSACAGIAMGMVDAQEQKRSEKK
jgi:hypothetical protein